MAHDFRYRNPVSSLAFSSLNEYTNYEPCRRQEYTGGMDRHWYWFLLAILSMPTVIVIPLLFWNWMQVLKNRMLGAADQMKRKGWEARVNMAISQIVSDQTKPGQILKLLGFGFSIGSLCIYLEETTWPCEDTEMCQRNGRLNFWWLVDVSFNSYLLVYFMLRFMATNQKLRFLFLTFTSYADYCTIPASFLALYLQRNWFGLRFMRIINLSWAIDLLHRRGYLKNIGQVQLTRLGVFIFIFIISGGGMFLALECGGDPWAWEESHQTNLTIWDYAYFSVVTISTVGYGDISARTAMGRIFSTLYIFFCVIYLATLMSSVAHLIPAPQRYPVADRNLNYNHVIVCGHVNFEMAYHFINDFYDDAKTKGTEKLQVVFLHPEEPNEDFVVLLNSYQTSVEYIKGSPLNDQDLEKARAFNASACLVFANLHAANPEADDAATVLRVLAIKNYCPTLKVQVSVVKTSTLNFLRQYPAINVKKGDVIFCFKNLKNGLIGINCRVPGSATILADLIAARTPTETLSENIPDLYSYGRKMKPFSVPFSSSFWGMNYKEAAALCYRKLKILLVGVYETFEESGEQSNFLFNPGSSFVINDRCRGQIICKTSKESVRALYYCDVCHPDVNPERIGRCQCKRYKRRNAIVSPAQIPRLSIKGPEREVRINSTHQDKTSYSGTDTPERRRSTMLGDSQNKLFFTDRRDSFLAGEKDRQRIQQKRFKLPRKSLSEQVLLHVKRSISLDYTKAAEGGASDALDVISRPQFDATGMFWWCNPQNFEDLIMTLEQAACREFSDHVILGILAQGLSNVTGIHDIILPLRSSVLPYEELKEIVILCDPSVIRKEWNLICTTPKLRIVQGNPSMPAALRACYIDYCAMCVVLSGAGEVMQKDASEDLVLADRDVIVTTLNIKAMEFGEHSDNSDHERLYSVAGNIPYQTGLNVPLISSLEHERSVRFLSQDRNYLDFRYTFAHMSGAVVVSTALDSMMTSMFYNPALAMSFTQLIYGGESTEFEKAFAEGIGLVGVGNHAEESDEEDEDVPRPRRRSRRLKVQLKLMSMKSEQFERLEGLTYADLWSYALVHYDMICIGLYLLERDTETKKVKKSHRGKRYVASNPPGHVRMHSSDLIYVLMPSVVV